MCRALFLALCDPTLFTPRRIAQAPVRRVASSRVLTPAPTLSQRVCAEAPAPRFPNPGTSSCGRASPALHTWGARGAPCWFAASEALRKRIPLPVDDAGRNGGAYGPGSAVLGGVEGRRGAGGRAPGFRGEQSRAARRSAPARGVRRGRPAPPLSRQPPRAPGVCLP